jgi:hypothetical protein
MQSLFSLHENYAQIIRKQFHLLFVHDDNKSNSTSNGHVVKNPKIFACLQKMVYDWTIFCYG